MNFKDVFKSPDYRRSATIQWATNIKKKYARYKYLKEQKAKLISEKRERMIMTQNALEKVITTPITPSTIYIDDESDSEIEVVSTVPKCTVSKNTLLQANASLPQSFMQGDNDLSIEPNTDWSKFDHDLLKYANQLSQCNLPKLRQLLSLGPLLSDLEGSSNTEIPVITVDEEKEEENDIVLICNDVLPSSPLDGEKSKPYEEKSILQARKVILPVCLSEETNEAKVVPVTLNGNTHFTTESVLNMQEVVTIQVPQVETNVEVPHDYNRHSEVGQVSYPEKDLLLTLQPLPFIPGHENLISPNVECQDDDWQMKQNILHKAQSGTLTNYGQSKVSRYSIVQKKKRKSPELRIRCKRCKKVFAFMKEFEKHYEMSHEPKKNKCPDCLYESDHEITLTRHRIRAHNLHLPFKCFTCNQHFGTHVHFRRHMAFTCCLFTAEIDPTQVTQFLPTNDKVIGQYEHSDGTSHLFDDYIKDCEWLFSGKESKKWGCGATRRGPWIDKSTFKDLKIYIPHYNEGKFAMVQVLSGSGYLIILLI